MTETTRKRRLVIEFELPDMYVEDLLDLIEEYGTDEPLGDQILHEIGEIGFGALTIEVSGEKDSEIVTVPVLARTARIEDKPPSKVEWLEDSVASLLERAHEWRDEKAYSEGYDDGLKDGRDWPAPEAAAVADQRGPDA